jgi:hypothetical protein
MAVAVMTDLVFGNTYRINYSIAIVSATAGTISVLLTCITDREFRRITSTIDGA